MVPLGGKDVLVEKQGNITQGGITPQDWYAKATSSPRRLIPRPNSKHSVGGANPNMEQNRDRSMLKLGRRQAMSHPQHGIEPACLHLRALRSRPARCGRGGSGMDLNIVCQARNDGAPSTSRREGVHTDTVPTYPDKAHANLNLVSLWWRNKSVGPIYY